MKARTREILSLIEDELIKEHKRSGDDYEYRAGVGSELWNILSALRGPDDEDERQKEHTVEIRRLAFPRLAAFLDEQVTSSAYVGNGPTFHPIPELKTDLSLGHFGVHVYMAYEVLGRIK